MSTQENRRIRYMLDGVEIDIDFWPRIPTYVEFEGESEQQIKDVCKKLDVDFSKLTTADVATIYSINGIKIVDLPAEIHLEEERKNQKYDI